MNTNYIGNKVDCSETYTAWLITIILQAGILADVETLYHTWCKFEGPHSGSLRVGALENENKIPNLPKQPHASLETSTMRPEGRADNRAAPATDRGTGS